MRLLKGLLKLTGLLVAIVAIAVIGLVGYLSVTEYKPADVERVEVTQAALNSPVRVGDMLKVVTFNTGYGGLDRSEDFFMDGGTGVAPKSRQQVSGNLAGILSALDAQGAQIYLLQETDVDSSRSFWIDQTEYYRHGLSLNKSFAYNYKCDFVPFPWPPIGKVASGLCTLTELNITEATRESLPVPFTWPVRAANLKRCLLIERIPVEDTQSELVIINLHLEAYDDGEGKAAQTAQLMNIIKAEYRKGNYVIAGGDFNQTFQGVERIGGDPEGKWQPGVLSNADLPPQTRFVFDASAPTCRSLDAPYVGDRQNGVFYVIDGFIITDNLKLNHIETVDLNFQHSDHNPVMMQVTLK